MEEDCCFSNWGLDAVVRLGCRRRLSPPRREDNNNNNPFAAFLPPPQKPAPVPVPELAKEPEADASWRFPDFYGGAGQDAGDELLRALLASCHPPMSSQPTPPPLPLPPSPQQQQPVVAAAVDVAPSQPRAAPASAPARAQPSGRQVPGGVPRSKRRKNQVKKVVCHVPADGSSSDVWAWRKYGQKPIKGSPYPRGYYRCSSSKGCAARKQVERSRTDPNTFILTYTGEHNHAAPTHRNSLAGTTRHKFPSSSAPQPPPPSVVVVGPSGDAQHQQTSTSPTSTSTAGLSPTTPLRTPSMEEEDDEMEMEEDELVVEDMEMAGEDELLFLNPDGGGAAPLETMSSLFDIAADEPFLRSPWVSSSAATVAGEPATGAAGAGS